MDFGIVSERQPEIRRKDEDAEEDMLEDGKWKHSCWK